MCSIPLSKVLVDDCQGPWDDCGELTSLDHIELNCFVLFKDLTD